MNIDKLILINSIQQYQQISQSVLEQQLKHEQKKFLFLPELFFNSHIQIRSFNAIKSYIDLISNRFFLLNHLTMPEQAWYKFYILLRAYREPYKDISLIIEEYKMLPQLNSNKQYMQWIEYETKNLMVSYYAIQGEDIEQLILEIENTDPIIQHFSA